MGHTIINKTDDKQIGGADYRIDAPRGKKTVFMDLFELSDYDKEIYGVLPLKDGEQLFRYSTDCTRACYGPILVKINVKRKLVYFLTDASFNGETEQVHFETRGIKLSGLYIY